MCERRSALSSAALSLYFPFVRIRIRIRNPFDLVLRCSEPPDAICRRCRRRRRRHRDRPLQDGPRDDAARATVDGFRRRSPRLGHGRRAGRRSHPAVVRLHAGAGGVRVRGPTEQRQHRAPCPLPLVSARLRAPAQERERAEGEGRCRLPPRQLQGAV